MIDFPCNCGHRFSVNEELAGSLIQCPQCRKLNDVPLLGDLQNLDESGIYKLDDNTKPGQDPNRVAKLTEVFTREHYDDQGAPIDLRGPSSDPSLIGAPKPVESNAPKYDPITGELLREIDVKPDNAPLPSTIPIARKAPEPTKTVIDGMDVPVPYEVFAIPGHLLRPANLLVILIIFLAQVAGQMMMIAIAMMFWLLAPFWLILHFLLLSHLANVIDETGPTSRQELPTPLRHLDWQDDTFGPAARVITSLVICYGPALLMVMNYHKKADAPAIFALMGALALVGTILFPAALLTATTSGSLANVRPDRLAGVARCCGWEYVLAVFTWIIATSIWLAGTIGVNWLGAVTGPSGIERPPPYVTLYSSYGMLILGIYLMHFFGWHLGVLYRRHHENFPWVLQRHVGGRRQLKPQDTAFPVQRPRRTRKIESAPSTRSMRVEPIPPNRRHDST